MPHDVSGKQNPLDPKPAVGAQASLPEGPYVIVHRELCKACGLCIASCPRKVLERGEVINSQGYPATRYTGDGCIGCATCFYVCPEPGAITVVKKPAKSGPDSGGTGA